MSEWFVVNNIKEFTNKARSIVYKNFGSSDDKTDLDILMDDIKKEEEAEFEKVLSYQESLVIVRQNVKKEINKKNKKIRYILDEEIFSNIIHMLNDRMVSNIINNLVNKGVIETGYDADINDFIFWIKDNDETTEEKPETD
jgi:hypothetical protein